MHSLLLLLVTFLISSSAFAGKFRGTWTYRLEVTENNCEHKIAGFEIPRDLELWAGEPPRFLDSPHAPSQQRVRRDDPYVRASREAQEQLSEPWNNVSWWGKHDPERFGVLLNAPPGWPTGAWSLSGGAAVSAQKWSLLLRPIENPITITMKLMLVWPAEPQRDSCEIRIHGRRLPQRR
jgi:hypothetical protein